MYIGAYNAVLVHDTSTGDKTWHNEVTLLVSVHFQLSHSVLATKEWQGEPEEVWWRPRPWWLHQVHRQACHRWAQGLWPFWRKEGKGGIMRCCGVRRAIVSIISFGVSVGLVCHLCTINRCFFLLTDNRLCSLYLPCCAGTFWASTFSFCCIGRTY